MERLSVLLSLVLGSAAQAQNLVPNGSFEQYTYCPDDISQFYDNIVGWSVVRLHPTTSMSVGIVSI